MAAYEDDYPAPDKAVFDDACGSSFCCRMHTARVPTKGCLSTWVGLANGIVLIVMFFYVLRKLFQSNRRSRAGYTKNTVSLDTHVSLLEGVLVWTVAWGLFQVFDFHDGTNDLPSPLYEGKSHALTTAATTAALYGASEAFVILIVLVLVSDSIGHNNLRRAAAAAAVYGTFIAITLGNLS